MRSTRSTLGVLLTAGSTALVAACASASTPAPGSAVAASESTSKAIASAGVGASTSKPPPAPAPKAKRVSIPGLVLSELVAGRAPSTASPAGTIFAIAYAEPPAATRFVVEIDLDRGVEVARVTLADEAVRPLLAREGDRLYALVKAEGGAPELVELELGLAIARRVPLGGADGKAKPKKKPKLVDLEPRALTVIDGRPILLGEGGLAYVFEASGELVSERSCKATLFSPQRYELVRIGARVLVNGLIDPGGDSMRLVACAFDADGKGAVDRLVVEAGSFLDVAPDGTLTLSGHDGEASFVAPVDAHLHVGPRTEPPAAEPGGPPPVDTCPGVEGDARWQDEIVHGRRVIRTVRCCGGTSDAGIWVCPPGA